ncbi:hypothetical protein [Chitinophaga sancti]|uniref:hypothetical protein n=1 Tax=Chitinophaga sancti TaxID=1004 RepID=UPI003F7ABE7F
MNFKYYNSWLFQNTNTEITESTLPNLKFYYRFYYEPSILCEVGQRCLRGVFDDIYYKGCNLKEISEYHKANFIGHNYFNVIENLTEFTISTKGYKNGIFTGVAIYNCNSNFDHERITRFDSNYQLVEYREATYTPENTLQKDKIFIPSLWQTFEEDY